MVFNRLMEIERIIDHLHSSGREVFFGHIPTTLNPADCATRGLNQHELAEHFWWTGPAILKEPTRDWSRTFKYLEAYERKGEDPGSPLPTEVSEILVTSQHADQAEEEHELEDVFQVLENRPLKETKRVVSYVLRFINKLVDRVNKRRPSPKQVSSTIRLFKSDSAAISGQEITAAGKLLVRLHQKSKITSSILRSLHTLNIKMDDEGLLRCYGRLEQSQLAEEAKKPLIVLQNSWLSKAIIRDAHSSGHPGISHTMAIVRQRYWIPKLRAQVTRIVRKCIPCQRFNNLPFKYPNQGALPKRRVQRSRPFAHVGLDYFGPLCVVQPDGNETKCYGCIITCTVTRLIHLDAVGDLSTTSFLRMLRRFFSRRGIPISVTSDNAPTFALADNILRDCAVAAQNDPEVERMTSNRGIEWHYITPYAPWQGGFYERLIKSVKHSLYKTLGKAKPSYDELHTILAETECLLNTRPLIHLDSNSPEEQVLRPIDFLQNEFEVPYPMDRLEKDEDDPTFVPPEEQQVIRTKLQAISALQSSCKLTEKFWQAWQTEYLTQLREKHQLEVGKQKGSHCVPRTDNLVLICDPVQPRHCWKMGRILELGRTGGAVREATVILPSEGKFGDP